MHLDLEITMVVTISGRSASAFSSVKKRHHCFVVIARDRPFIFQEHLPSFERTLSPAPSFLSTKVPLDALLLSWDQARSYAVQLFGGGRANFSVQVQNWRVSPTKLP